MVDRNHKTAGRHSSAKRAPAERRRQARRELGIAAAIVMCIIVGLLIFHYLTVSHPSGPVILSVVTATPVD